MSHSTCKTMTLTANCPQEFFQIILKNSKLCYPNIGSNAIILQKSSLKASHWPLIFPSTFFRRSGIILDQSWDSFIIQKKSPLKQDNLEHQSIPTTEGLRYFIQLLQAFKWKPDGENGSISTFQKTISWSTSGTWWLSGRMTDGWALLIASLQRILRIHTRDTRWYSSQTRTWTLKLRAFQPVNLRRIQLNIQPLYLVTLYWKSLALQWGKMFDFV